MIGGLAPKLSARQKQLLYYLAQIQIEKCEPVGSLEIKQRYDINLSSSTIRREFCFLCQKEYLIQPHTSAGRILSDFG